MPDDRLFDLPPAIVRRREAVPVDLIFTSRPTHAVNTVAQDAGWLLGIQSTVWTKAKPEDAKVWDLFSIAFVDNEWKAYEHADHVAAVRALQPKYATVRDYVPERAAQAAGIAFYTLDEVLDMAYEVQKYAENVIVIPKDADVLDAIPMDYVIGYSVPSSYGSSPFEVERLAGRRIHLLGGSWATQRTIIAKMGEAIVSADLNHPWKASRYGTVVMGDGTMKDLVSFGMYPRNLSLASLTLSLGNIAAAVIDISHMRDHGVVMA